MLPIPEPRRGRREVAGARMAQWSLLLGLALLFGGCSADCDGALGRDEEPPCVLCTAQVPYWEACESPTVAAGGQPVCETESGVRLCQTKRRCRERSEIK